MKSHVLHTVWRNISGEAAGEIWHWSGFKGFTRGQSELKSRIALWINHSNNTCPLLSLEKRFPLERGTGNFKDHPSVAFGCFDYFPLGNKKNQSNYNAGGEGVCVCVCPSNSLLVRPVVLSLTLICSRHSWAPLDLHGAHENAGSGYCFGLFPGSRVDSQKTLTCFRLTTETLATRIKELQLGQSVEIATIMKCDENKSRK